MRALRGRGHDRAAHHAVPGGASDRLADDIALVDHGRVAHTGSPAELKALIGSYAEVVVAHADAMPGAAAVLDRLTGSEPAFAPERHAVGGDHRSDPDPAPARP